MTMVAGTKPLFMRPPAPSPQYLQAPPVVYGGLCSEHELRVRLTAGQPQPKPAGPAKHQTAGKELTVATGVADRMDIGPARRKDET